MAISKLNAASNANDFNLNLTGFYTKITLNKEYAAGSYSIVSGNNDVSLDIYSFNSDGSSAGATSTKSFTASKGFNKLVIVGGVTGDVLSFSFKTTYATASAGSETGVPPVPVSISPTDLPNKNSTATVSGFNFASGMTVNFIGTDNIVRPAKSTVVGSATSAIVTRPDTMPASAAPYSLSITYAAVTPPVGSIAGVLANAATAGSGPSWTTAATLPAFTSGVSYSTTVVATDPDAAGVIASYSIAAGALPTGLSLASATGIISGTPTSSSQTTVTIRATNQDGDFVDRVFTVPNAGPVWTTAAGAIDAAVGAAAYSFTLIASDDSGLAPTYAVTAGSLPAGLTLSSSGVITGTPSGSGTSSFTVTATDANGGGTARAFSINVIAANTWSQLYSSTIASQVNEGYWGFHAGSIYLGGGQTTGTQTFPTSFYKVNVSTGVATLLAAGPQRDEVGSVMANGKLYVIGGAIQNGSGGQSNTMHIYNVATNTWTQGAAFSEIFYNSHVGTDGTNVFFVPASTSYSRTMIRYNVANDNYTVLAATGTAGDDLAGQTPKMAYVASANVFYTNGYSNANAAQRLYRYNVAANNWTILAGSLPRQYSDQLWSGANNYAFGFEYLSSRNAIYIFAWDQGNSIGSGVTRNAGVPDKILKYDITAATWSLVAPEIPLVGGATWSSGNALYALGGQYRDAANATQPSTAMHVIYPS